MKEMSVEELEDVIKTVIKSDGVDVLVKLALTNCWNELLRRFEALECCGNCGVESQLCYKVNGTIIIKQPKYHYCGNYKPDGLTRAEREGK